MNQSIKRGGALALFAFVLALTFFVNPLNSGNAHAASYADSKVTVVNLAQGLLSAYDNGSKVYTSLVVSGRPGLETPTGTYHVFAKLSPTTFYSPWPPSSPNYYAPTHINFALEFKEGGYFLHDSWWHTVYGPGTNGWHYDPTYGWQYGSHGCVSLPLSAARWLYTWAPIGTTVQINS